MGKVAVIILNWNGEALLRRFLPSVVRNTPSELGTVIVVDNHSEDNSVEFMRKEYPEVELLCLDDNYGFAGGYNRAIEQIEAEYVLLLNSDVEVEHGWLQPLVKVLDEQPEVAAVQPKLKSWNHREYFEYAGASGGYIDKYGFPFCRGRILKEVEKDKGQYEDEVAVFWCSGAALCVRREVYLACGGLDVRFFAHMEEIDLCWRMQNAGYTLKVVPASVVYHLGGGTLPMNHPGKLFLNYRNNLLMLYKNLGKKEYKRVMRMRRMLDSVAGIIFFLKGEFTNAGAVYRAYRSFHDMKKYYLQTERGNKLSAVYPRSIIYDFFCKRLRTFSLLLSYWK
ncbi:glycosyltransferase family 2 protein [Odoribacter lunatus]|uniref:glycosyltransferase family 2 protein n=1 Tax=Odoribacter lunatus TaxID=2941335 RepID=UPI00203D545A|nr:glycosyltransferase family 2 protein [Odoribacter lunatus]